MTFRIVRATLTVAFLVLGLQVFAGEPVDKAVEESLRKSLAKPALGLLVESIDSSEMPGIYAVQFSNGPVVYSNADGSYFIVGDLHEVTADGFVNLTEKSRDGDRVELIAQVDRKDMIVFSPEGETRAYINVFTDVTCFYCQKLHLEVPELNKQGIEVRYLAYPRAGVGSPGFRKLATAWCAKDRQGTLTKLKAKEPVDEEVCDDNPVAAQFELGQIVGVRGTPAIVTQEGRLIPGYQAADELIAGLGLK